MLGRMSRCATAAAPSAFLPEGTRGEATFGKLT